MSQLVEYQKRIKELEHALEMMILFSKHSKSNSASISNALNVLMKGSKKNEQQNKA